MNATFQVQGVAQITLSVQSLASPVQVGQYEKATILVANKGSAKANVTLTGTTTLNGATVGNWSTKTVAVGAGQSVSVALQTAATISISYAGDILTATFTGTY